MTPEAQRIAIAEACGWKYWQSKHGHFYVESPEGERSEPAFGWPKFDSITGEKLTIHWWDGVNLPDYVTDLNAMHKAEKTMSPGHRSLYREKLEEVVEETSDEFLVSAIHATAAQRAEAFLRTIRKWDDSK